MKLIITVDYFISAIIYTMPSSNVSADVVDKYQLLFNKLDRIADGRIDLNELTHYFETRKVPHGNVKVYFLFP